MVAHVFSLRLLYTALYHYMHMVSFTNSNNYISSQSLCNTPISSSGRVSHILLNGDNTVCTQCWGMLVNETINQIDECSLEVLFCHKYLAWFNTPQTSQHFLTKCKALLNVVTWVDCIHFTVPPIIAVQLLLCVIIIRGVLLISSLSCGSPHLITITLFTRIHPPYNPIS